MTNKVLRCEQVVRELASASHDPSLSADLAGHLEGCPECSAWSKNDAALLTVWRESAPLEPNEAIWGNLWASLSERIDQAELVGSKEVATVYPLRRELASRKRMLAIAGFGLAQAAAVLLALTLGGRHTEDARKVADADVQAGQNRVVSVQSESPSPVVDIESGKTILIQKDGDKVKSVELAYEDPSNLTNFDLLGVMEAMAN